MKKSLKNIFYIFLVLIFFTACQSLKDGLTGQKKNNSDEFLVKKKNPLVLPPEFDELPEPKKKTNEVKKTEEEIDLSSILTKKSETNKSSNSENSEGSLEKIILEKIKNN
jgi:hypothetical protein